MKRIYKYELKIVDYQDLELPKNSKILSVKNQYENIVVYAIVDTEIKIYDLYHFVIKGTGHDLPEGLDDYDFLGTVKLAKGELMFHIFYKKLKNSNNKCGVI